MQQDRTVSAPAEPAPHAIMTGPWAPHELALGGEVMRFGQAVSAMVCVCMTGASVPEPGQSSG